MDTPRSKGRGQESVKKGIREFRKRYTEVVLGLQLSSIVLVWLSLATKVGWLNLWGLGIMGVIGTLLGTVLVRKLTRKVDLIEENRHNKTTALAMVTVIVIVAMLETAGVIAERDTYILAIPLAGVISLAVYIMQIAKEGSVERKAVERQLAQRMYKGKGPKPGIEDLMGYQRKIQGQKGRKRR